MSTEKKSLVEEALLQMKNLQEVVTENAKGILASTMKEEIEELVKESLEEGTENERMEDEMNPEMEEGTHMSMEEEEDDSLEIDMSDDDMELPMGSMDNMDNMGDDMEMGSEDMEFGDDEELSPLDMTQASDDELLRVVLGMGDEDRLIIQKDGDEADVDMLTQTDSMSFPLGGEDDMEMDSEDYEEDEEIVYEIEMEEDEMEEDEMEEDEMEEDEDAMNESMTVKPKGVGMGSGPKKVVFKGENVHKGPKGKSSPEAKKFIKSKGEMKEDEMEENYGSKKHEYKRKEVNGVEKKAGEKDGHYKDYEETKEAARTLGNGTRNARMRKSLPKMKVITNSSLKEEVETLRAKNDEYRKALNIFREKLNEVAVFNSNLAYATRLFTEHSTTKQEKINIMRRFDNVETIKESKNLYTQIKGELDNKQSSVVKESIVENIDRTPSNGSTNLIESKTYENPQFLRMKDLMSKLNK
jgi:hypothetical protein